MVHELSHLKPAPVTINYADQWSDPLDIQQAAQLQATNMPGYAEAYQYFAWHLPIWQPPPSGCSLSTRRGSAAFAGVAVAGLFLALVAGLLRRRQPMRTTAVVVALALVVLVAVVVRRGAAQDRVPPPRLMPEAQLPTISLRCEVDAPARVRLGEPLPVTVRLTNTGAEALSFYGLGTAWNRRWQPFDVSYDDGQHVPAKWDGIAVTMGPPQARGYLKVGAGETISSTVSVPDPWTLRPGVLMVKQGNLADTLHVATEHKYPLGDGTSDIRFIGDDRIAPGVFRYARYFPGAYFTRFDTARTRVLAVDSSNRKELETIIRNNFDANAPVKEQADDYDIIFTTEVLAEGVNLQDAALLINFDVHWNPVRMIQRAGRIDRRLNPAIEEATSFPDLEALARDLGVQPPRYWWHAHAGAAPITVNLLLPDELEAELQLRERIANKTLAIDFTLGLEQGTGAEADWMAEYRYQGISALNAWQGDRAIEQIAGYHQRLRRMMSDCGIDPAWVDAWNGWLREAGGRVTDWQGGETWLHGQQVLATNGALHPVVLDYLSVR